MVGGTTMFGLEHVRRFYDLTLRPYLPEKYRLLAGVAVRDTPLFDLTADKPNYKRGLMTAIERGVREGDIVDLVGYGRGVSTIRAFDAGASHVTAYEASEEMIELANETVTVNRPFGTDVTVKHALVGDPIKIYGDASGADVVDPSTLCESDVLVLDCEGSEKSILESLGSFPRTIICETHPERGVSTAEVVDTIDDSYVVDLLEYEPDEGPKKVVYAEKA